MRPALNVVQGGMRNELAGFYAAIRIPKSEIYFSASSTKAINLFGEMGLAR
jgi:hypothetical protein